jgi:hypothetical protein
MKATLTWHAVACILAALVVVYNMQDGVTPTTVAESSRSAAASPISPHETENGIGVVGIGVSGRRLCSGLPLRGTRYVVTATHCLANHTILGYRTKSNLEVTLDSEVVANVVGLVIDARYFYEKSPRWDVSVVEADTVFDFGADSYGPFPESGRWEAYGMQRVSLAGDPLSRDETPRHACEVYDCGHEPEHRRFSDQLTLYTDHRVAGCEGDVNSGSGHGGDGWTYVQCGLLRGASGGPVLVRDEGQVIMVGVISTINYDDSTNGVGPVDSRLEELLGDHSVGFYIAVRTPLVVPNDGPMAAAERHFERMSAWLQESQRDAENTNRNATSVAGRRV